MIDAVHLKDCTIQLSAEDTFYAMENRKPVWIVVGPSGQCIVGIPGSVVRKFMDLSHVIHAYSIDLSDYNAGPAWVVEYFEDV